MPVPRILFAGCACSSASLQKLSLCFHITVAAAFLGVMAARPVSCDTPVGAAVIPPKSRSISQIGTPARPVPRLAAPPPMRTPATPPGVAPVGPLSPALLQSLPSLRVALSRDRYLIQADAKTGAPRMPSDVVANAQPVNWPKDAPSPAKFKWRVFLDWSFLPYPTHHSIHNFAFNRASPFAIDLGHEVRGGMLTVVATADVHGRPVSGQASAAVAAENPSREVLLRAFPRSRFGLLASKLATAESDLRQFGPDGLPTLSRTNDVGLMQLNAPSGSITSADQVWDWRANLQRGLAMLSAKRQITVLASRHADHLQRQWDVNDPNFATLAFLNSARALLGLDFVLPPDTPPLSAAPGTGILPGEQDPDHLCLSQVEREAIRRYNGGREYVYLFAANGVTLGLTPVGWRLDTTRGGINAKSGDPAYVDHVLLAHSGFVLPPPPKPKVSAPHRRVHHRRHHHR